MIPSLNLATDSLGLGAMYQSIFNKTGTAECGSRPGCISLGKKSNCAAKQRAYEACTLKALETQNTMVTRSADVAVSEDEAAAQAAKSKRTLYIILAIVALIILLLIFKRRQS
jgi:hypothetical protein